MKKIVVVLFVMVTVGVVGIFLFNVTDALRTRNAPSFEESGGNVQTPPQSEEQPDSLGEEKLYTSNTYGLQFTYPNTYYLRETEAGTPERPQAAIVLVADTKENRDLLDGKVTEPREGPTSITVDIYQNPDGLSPEDWATTDTNWNLGSKVTVPEQVGGRDGVSYLWDGLYAGKSTIVTDDKHAYVFSVTWMTTEDAIITDYAALLTDVVFAR